MRRLALTAALLAALFASPATASANSCGATAAHWLGTYTGTETDTRAGEVYPRPTTIEITEGPVVSMLAPYSHESPYNDWYPDESPDLTNGTWTVNYAEYFPYKGTYYEDRDYTVSQVTCSGDQVTEFSGTFLKTMTWIGTGTQTETFTVHL